MRLCLKQGGMRLHARAAALAQPSGQHVHAGGWHAEWAIALPTRTAGAQHTGLVRCCPTPNTENSSLSAAPHWSSPRGPEPEATPERLFAELARFLAGDVYGQEDNLTLLLSLSPQLGDAEVAGRLAAIAAGRWMHKLWHPALEPGARQEAPYRPHCLQVWCICASHLVLPAGPTMSLPLPCLAPVLQAHWTASWLSSGGRPSFDWRLTLGGQPPGAASWCAAATMCTTWWKCWTRAGRQVRARSSRQAWVLQANGDAGGVHCKLWMWMSQADDVCL